MNEYRRYSISLQAKERAELVELYRGLRRDDPVLARLVWRRAKNVENEIQRCFEERFFSDGFSQEGGLAALVAR